MPSKFLFYAAGGFLSGKRTYLLVALAVLSELVRWAVGDQTLSTLTEHLPSIFGELSVGALRAGVASSVLLTPPAPAVAQTEESFVTVQIRREDITDAVRDWIEQQRNRV